MGKTLFDFDELIVRRGTGCVKWDEAPADDVLPLWVADMDFRAAPAIRRAIERRAAQGVFGYALVGDDYYRAVQSWFLRRHQWRIDRASMLYTTGVVPALSCVVKALTLPGERVLVQTPVYNCFFSSIRNNGCQVAESALLKETDGRYTVDWDGFERECADPKTTVFVLCNPHNPVGRMWTADELRRMADVCQHHGVRMVSDEIHCELAMPGHRYVPLLSLDHEWARQGIALGSPSKSFNIAGLQMAFIVCDDAATRRRIDRAININEVCDVNPFAPVAGMAAYNESEDWMDALNEYVQGNYRELCAFVERELPQVRVTPLEATYLAWLDIRAFGLTSDEFTRRLTAEGRVMLSSGTLYGQAGEGFVRLNMACQRTRLTDALARIKRWTEQLSI